MQTSTSKFTLTNDAQCGRASSERGRSTQEMPSSASGIGGGGGNSSARTHRETQRHRKTERQRDSCSEKQQQRTGAAAPRRDAAER